MSKKSSKVKYAIINGDMVIALVYENDKYGRTMVILEKVNPRCNIRVFSVENNTTISDVDFLEYLHGLLPKDS